MIRPFGKSELKPASKLDEMDASLPAVVSQTNTRPFTDALNLRNVSFKLYQKHYGGPGVLAQHRAYISIPYQTSTMKMYENLAAGVVTLVPSPSFLKVLLHQPGYELSAIDKTGKSGSDWFEYIELYHPDLRDFYYEFEDIDHLKRILNRRVIDSRNVREKAPEYWKSANTRSLELWLEVLNGFI